MEGDLPEGAGMLRPHADRWRLVWLASSAAGQDHIALGMVLGAQAGVRQRFTTAEAAAGDLRRLLMQDERFGSFECAITAGDKVPSA